MQDKGPNFSISGLSQIGNTVAIGTSFTVDRSSEKINRHLFTSELQHGSIGARTRGIGMRIEGRTLKIGAHGISLDLLNTTYINTPYRLRFRVQFLGTFLHNIRITSATGDGLLQYNFFGAVVP
jgi:hypothetical protein